MVSFDEFLQQDEADKYNMLQECNAIIQQKDNIIKELEKFVKNCNEYNSKCNSTIYEARAFEDSVILYKIKELKGEGNSE